jgi:hypothetical protein
VVCSCYWEGYLCFVLQVLVILVIIISVTTAPVNFVVDFLFERYYFCNVKLLCVVITISSFLQHIGGTDRGGA